MRRLSRSVLLSTSPIATASPLRSMPTKRKAPASDGAANKRYAPKQTTLDAAFGVPNGDANSNNSPEQCPPSSETAPPADYPVPEVVQREFYPPEISNERCAQYNNNELPRPIEELHSAAERTRLAREAIAPGSAVVHWFKRDLRIHDNRGLSKASAKAQEAGVPLICVFVVSPQDYQAHLTAAVRVDFELRTLEVLKADLAELDIPLVALTIEKRKGVPARLVQQCETWGAKHVFCNMEYEVDELRREARLTELCLEKGVALSVTHDDVIVPPGDLRTGQGRQYAVYSPWYRAWVKHLNTHPHLLSASPPPDRNPADARTRFASLFDCPIPPAPANKRLEPSQQQRMAALWPAGEHEAHARLEKFLDTKAAQYKAARDSPSADGTASVSVHHSAGTLAARTSVRLAQERNKGRLDSGDEGLKRWISEVAWRDFYKHVLAHWPFVCMHKPFKPAYANLEWEYDSGAFRRWCEGQTGYPLVDAAMRQLNAVGYVHNRARMVAASFLCKHLLLDWRLGERYFMEHLVDGDFASNNGGWGFCASVGVDPAPYFRVFNPVLQGERFDPEGAYIRSWVDELRGVEGRKVHDPYARGAGEVVRKRGYPRMMVEHKSARERALERFKRVGEGK